MLGEVRDHRPDDGQVVDARPTCGNRSLTGMPLSPYRRNFHGQLSTFPTLLNCVGWVLTLIGCPCSRSSLGLGSNVSICDGPPSMNRKMTLVALAAKCGGLGASGLALVCRSSGSARRRIAQDRTESRIAAGHRPQGRRSRCHTAGAYRGGSSAGSTNRWQCMELPRINRLGARKRPSRMSVDEDKLFHIDQHMAEIGPGFGEGSAVRSSGLCSTSGGQEFEAARASRSVGGRPKRSLKKPRRAARRVGRGRDSDRHRGPKPGLAEDQRVIQEGQCLRGDIRRRCAGPCVENGTACRTPGTSG